jgi:hypothetical protein
MDAKFFTDRFFRVLKAHDAGDATKAPSGPGSISSIRTTGTGSTRRWRRTSRSRSRRSGSSCAGGAAALRRVGTPRLELLNRAGHLVRPHGVACLRPLVNESVQRALPDDRGHGTEGVR